MKSLLTIGSMALVLIVSALAPVYAQTPMQTRGQDRATEARANAQQRTEQIRQETQMRSLSIREDICERRAERMQQNIPNLARSSVRLLEVMDRMHLRVQDFYESGQLTVDNYLELNENAEAARVDAQDAVRVVEEFTFEFDCAEPGVGQQLDGFRQAVREAREELKMYRAELVALISALRAEAAEANANNETEDEEIAE